MNPHCPNGHDFSVHAQIGSAKLLLVMATLVYVAPVYCGACGHVYGTSSVTADNT